MSVYIYVTFSKIRLRQLLPFLPYSDQKPEASSNIWIIWETQMSWNIDDSKTGTSKMTNWVELSFETDVEMQSWRSNRRMRKTNKHLWRPMHTEYHTKAQLVPGISEIIMTVALWLSRRAGGPCDVMSSSQQKLLLLLLLLQTHQSLSYGSSWSPRQRGSGSKVHILSRA